MEEKDNCLWVHVTLEANHAGYRMHVVNGKEPMTTALTAMWMTKLTCSPVCDLLPITETI